MGISLERTGPPPIPSKASLKAARARALAALEGTGLVRSRHNYAVTALVRGALDGTLSQDDFPYLTAPPPAVPLDDASAASASVAGRVAARGFLGWCAAAVPTPRFTLPLVLRVVVSVLVAGTGIVCRRLSPESCVLVRVSVCAMAGQAPQPAGRWLCPGGPLGAPCRRPPRPQPPLLSRPPPPPPPPVPCYCSSLEV
jgi:hypothetical protein